MLLCQSNKSHDYTIFRHTVFFSPSAIFLNCLLNYVSLLSNFPNEHTLKILKKNDNIKISYSDTLMQTLQPYLP